MRYLKNSISFCIIILTPVVLSAQGLHIVNGGRLILNGPVNLVLNDIAFTNDGSFTAGNSQVLFTGIKTANAGGTSISAFNNLAIQKNSNSVQLTQDITVSGTLAINKGNLLLNKHTIDLGATGNITGEVNNRSIMGANGGSITVKRFLKTAPNAFNPGNIGVELTSAVIPQFVTVTRSHIQQSLPDGSVSIQRKFDITTGSSASLNAKLRFFYFDHELAGNDESSLILWTVSDAGNFWIPVGKDSSNTTANWVLKSGLDKLGSFTLAAPGGAFARIGANPVQQENNNPAPVYDKARIYPNPANNTVTLQLISKQEKKVAMNLVDVAGRILQHKEVACITGMNLVNWDIRNYPAGAYFITFRNIDVKNIQFTKN